MPLRKWIFAMYLLVTARKSIRSLQLANTISVTQKTAWFMLHRLPRLRGTIEVDELREACGNDTYIGGKEANKHDSKKLRAGRGAVGKTPVPALLDRITDIVLRYRPQPKSKAAKKRNLKRPPRKRSKRKA